MRKKEVEKDKENRKRECKANNIAKNAKEKERVKSKTKIRLRCIDEK